MIVTTYTCDKCGHSQNDDAQMWNIAVDLWTRGVPRSRSSYPPDSAELWCRKCVVGVLGKLSSGPDGPPKPDPLPTLEDMIREIIREEIGETI